MRPNRRALRRALDNDRFSKHRARGDRAIDGGTRGEPVMPRLRRILAPLASVVICIGLTAVVLAALPSSGEEKYSFGDSLGIIGRTVWERVLLPRPPRLETGYRNWIQTLVSATPILLTGLAVAVAFRANVLNIGGQGQYVAGAIATAAVGVYLHAPSPILIMLHLIAAMVAGAMLA